MKTILRIIMILLVAAVIAGAFSLAVNNSTAASSNNSGQPPTLTGSQPTTRPEGGNHDGGSITTGLAGVLGTVAKLTGITILVLMLQKAFNQPGKQKLISAHR